MSTLSVLDNDRIKPGGNLAPEQIVFGEIELFYDEVKLWADGKNGKGIASDDLEGIKEALDTLDKALLKAWQEADALRIAQKKPHDDAAQAVQDTFNPYTQKAKGKVDMARAALNKVRVGINTKIAEQNAAAAAIKQAEADAEIAAFKAAREANDGSLEAAEQIGQLEASTKLAQRAAKSSGKAASTGLGLKPVHTLKVTDARALAGWLWKFRREEVEAAHAELAQSLFRASTRGQGGASEMDGTEIITEMKAR